MGLIGDLEKLFSIKHKTKFTVDPIIFSKISHIDHRIQMGYQANGVWSTEYFWERERKSKKKSFFNYYFPYTIRSCLFSPAFPRIFLHLWLFQGLACEIKKHTAVKTLGYLSGSLTFFHIVCCWYYCWWFHLLPWHLIFFSNFYNIYEFISVEENWKVYQVGILRKLNECGHVWEHYQHLIYSADMTVGYNNVFLFCFHTC